MPTSFTMTTHLLPFSVSVVISFKFTLTRSNSWGCEFLSNSSCSPRCRVITCSSASTRPVAPTILDNFTNPSDLRLMTEPLSAGASAPPRTSHSHSSGTVSSYITINSDKSQFKSAAGCPSVRSLWSLPSFTFINVHKKCMCVLLGRLFDLLFQGPWLSAVCSGGRVNTVMKGFLQEFLGAHTASQAQSA